MSALGQPGAQKKIILVILNFTRRLWQRVQEKPQTPSSPNTFQQNLKVKKRSLTPRF